MAASFVKQSNGSYYLKLTENTTQVYFAAVSNAGNTYKLYANGELIVSKPYNDSGNTYYSSSAYPYQAGWILSDARFPGTQTIKTYSGSGTRYYLLSFTASPSPGTAFYLGGESLNWGTNLYAYPGSGYLSNALAVGVKDGGNWKNSGNIFVKDSNQWKEVDNAWVKTNGAWKQFFQNYGNSSWINMLEQTDDAIDFAVQVHAAN